MENAAKLSVKIIYKSYYYITNYVMKWTRYGGK